MVVYGYYISGFLKISRTSFTYILDALGNIQTVYA